MAQKSFSLEVDGMTCVNCAQTLEKYLAGKGFEQVKVNYASKDVSFKADEADYKASEINQGIAQLGYRVVSQDTQQKQPFSIRLKIIIAALLTFPLFLGHIFMFLHVPQFHFLHLDWVQFLFALPVYIIGVHQFGRSAWFALRQGTIHMDVLIFMGSSAAFFYSLAGTIAGNPEMIFYETAAMIITLVLVGNYMELRAIKQTTTAIEALSSLQADFALKYEGNQLVKVPAKDLKINDRVQVNEGDRVPADGKITEGEGRLDESMLTGESLPVFRKANDSVVEASVNLKGQFSMVVTAAGADTVLQNIIRLVKEAQADKPDIQRLADKISAVFVPLVLGIAALTLLLSYYVFDVAFTQALLNSIAVLVISCPCAMGLATPTAVMVGVGKVARKGILIRGGSTLEEFAATQYMLLDKTGTLTTGSFTIGSIDYNGNDPALVDALIYRMEEKSSHPVATAIRTHLKNAAETDLPITLNAIEEIGGSGMRAMDSDGNEYTLGMVNSPADTQNSMPDFDIVLTQNGEFISGFNVFDEVKPNTIDTIDYLKQQGISPVLISGDRVRKVQETAEKLGISTWHATQSPADKLALVEQYRQKGKTTMVGDGINDAPALAKADLGVSLSNASEVAIQSSRIVLLGGDIAHLEQAMKISKATLLTIKQNLGWAFSYNIVAIPIAALGFLNPMWAAVFMAFSDIVVIGNSVRLKFRKL